jgi:hypothetical protein
MKKGAIRITDSLDYCVKNYILKHKDLEGANRPSGQTTPLEHGDIVTKHSNLP